jgi:hypothetical protein
MIIEPREWTPDGIIEMICSHRQPELVDKMTSLCASYPAGIVFEAVNNICSRLQRTQCEQTDLFRDIDLYDLPPIDSDDR